MKFLRILQDPPNEDQLKLNCLFSCSDCIAFYTPSGEKVYKCAPKDSSVLIVMMLCVILGILMILIFIVLILIRRKRREIILGNQKQNKQNISPNEKIKNEKGKQSEISTNLNIGKEKRGSEKSYNYRGNVLTSNSNIKQINSNINTNCNSTNNVFSKRSGDTETLRKSGESRRPNKIIENSNEKYNNNKKIKKLKDFDIGLQKENYYQKDLNCDLNNKDKFPTNIHVFKFSKDRNKCEERMMENLLDNKYVVRDKDKNDYEASNDIKINKESKFKLFSKHDEEALNIDLTKTMKIDVDKNIVNSEFSNKKINCIIESSNEIIQTENEKMKLINEDTHNLKILGNMVKKANENKNYGHPPKVPKGKKINN